MPKRTEPEYELKLLKVPIGTKLLLGAPATPMPKTISDAIAELAASVPGVLEAHLPQCFAAGIMNAPTQTSVVTPNPAIHGRG